MLDYIVNQTVSTYNIVSGQTNGIYAYINGEYLDGVGWVPDEDYVPTERPWYIDAVAGAGKVVVVDPYVDAQTGTTMVTLARLLNDGKSVVAVGNGDSARRRLPCDLSSAQPSGRAAA